jgi:hypothetical protein
MSSASDSSVTPDSGSPDAGSPDAAGDALTIAEAAVAVGTGRHLIRTQLKAGAFPNAAKDAQGFWRIPRRDLVTAGLTNTGTDAAPILTPEQEGPEREGPEREADALVVLRLENIELRGRAERAEELLEVERRLSAERARTLETERATIEALYLQVSGGRLPPKPRAPEPPRGDWQASLRAARARDAQLRAERERERARREPPVKSTATREPQAETSPATPPLDESTGLHESTRRSRWRRR